MCIWRWTYGEVGIGSSVGGTVDPNASATGVSKNRSGYLVYLANKDTGAVTSPVILVPYNSAPAEWFYIIGIKVII